MARSRRRADIGGFDLSPENAAGDEFDESSDDGGLISAAPAVELVDRYGNAGNAQPLDQLFTGIDGEAAGEAVDAMNAALATGDNPLSIVNTLAGILGVSQARAETIARTEMLSAWRDAQSINFRANSDVLDGWIWSADLAGACIACVMMDGSVHILDEDMDTHPNCECCQLPLTKSYNDLLGDIEGFDTDLLHALAAEPDYINQGFMDGEEWFLRQGEAYQIEVLGPAKFEAWAAGDVELLDFVGQKDAGPWGNEIYERSLKEIGLDANAYLGRATELADLASAEETASTEVAAEIADTVGGRAADAFIHPDDVAAWTADNAEGVPSIGFHAASEENIARIAQEGVDVTLNENGAFGRGFYMFARSDEMGTYGSAEVQVAIRMEHPLIMDGNDPNNLLEQFIHTDPRLAEMTEREVLDNYPQMFTDYVLKQGYDGIIVQAPEFEQMGGDMVLAIKQDTVRVITDTTEK